ncbi:hypothetical protein GIB67_007133 [Kingdonia uniflora]|uniref:Uncharacterized protein n=1 Tax=Kingdonia uniflora TaxID=39325 RepID=A0A7J7MLD3_9MAGN|nr:hypothetical protein GIB67_007133 [Kingdonia uniflora]
MPFLDTISSLVFVLKEDMELSLYSIISTHTIQMKSIHLHSDMQRTNILIRIGFFTSYVI